MRKTESDNFSAGDPDDVGTIQRRWVVVGMIWRCNHASFSTERLAAACEGKKTLCYCTAKSLFLKKSSQFSTPLVGVLEITPVNT